MRVLLCNYCDFKAHYKSRMLTHIEHVHMKLKKFSCLFCDFKSCYKRNLTKHIQRRHSQTKVKGNGEQQNFSNVSTVRTETVDLKKKEEEEEVSKAQDQVPSPPSIFTTERIRRVVFLLPIETTGSFFFYKHPPGFPAVEGSMLTI